MYLLYKFLNLIKVTVYNKICIMESICFGFLGNLTTAWLADHQKPTFT